MLTQTSLQSSLTTAHQDSDSSLTIKKVDDLGELEKVYSLVCETYQWRGYLNGTTDTKKRLYHEFDRYPSTTTFIALVADRIVGTISTTRDGRDGLTIDRDFKDVTQRLRMHGHRIFCAWRFAVALDCHATRLVSTSLITTALTRFMAGNAQLCLFVCNPRHELFYRRCLKAHVLARSERDTHDLHGAPAVLLGIHRASLPQRWYRQCGDGQEF